MTRMSLLSYKNSSYKNLVTEQQFFQFSTWNLGWTLIMLRGKYSIILNKYNRLKANLMNYLIQNNFFIEYWYNLLLAMTSSPRFRLSSLSSFSSGILILSFMTSTSIRYGSWMWIVYMIIHFPGFCLYFGYADETLQPVCSLNTEFWIMICLFLHN